MGAKAIKEKYRIKHIVQKTGNVIWIGSSMASEIIGINQKGEIIKFYKNRNYNDGWSTNNDLRRYQEEMIIDQKSGELKKLVQSIDQYTDLLPVFTIGKGKVIKKSCVKYGWPNICTDGELQYNNTFFKTYDKAYQYLLNDSKSGVKMRFRSLKERVKEACKKISSALVYLAVDIYEYLYARTIQRYEIH